MQRGLRERSTDEMSNANVMRNTSGGIRDEQHMQRNRVHMTRERSINKDHLVCTCPQHTLNCPECGHHLPTGHSTHSQNTTFHNISNISPNTTYNHPDDNNLSWNENGFLNGTASQMHRHN